MKNSIMIINYSMVPYARSWGGCQRMYFLAEQLAQKGIDTMVIACKMTNIANNYGKNISFQIIFANDNIDIKSKNIKQKFLLFYYIKKLLKYLPSKIEKAYFNEISPGSGIKSFLWIKKYFFKIDNLIELKNPSTVVISCPPFAMLAIINKIKKKYSKIKIVIDYRDPWNLWNKRVGLAYFREKKYLNIAEKIVVTTEALRDEISNEFNIARTKIFVVKNGYSESEWSKIKEFTKSNSDKVIISYIGSIGFTKGSYRDISEFFAAYELLDNKSMFKFRFIGVSENDDIKTLRKKYPEIIFKSKVSQLDSFRYMQNSDVLFNIHTATDDSSKYLIGGKIYDYLKSGKMILSINSSDSYEHYFLKKISDAMCCENNSAEILKHFNMLRDDFAKKGYIDNITIKEGVHIEKYSRENQNKIFLDLLEV